MRAKKVYSESVSYTRHNEIALIRPFIADALVTDFVSSLAS